MKRKYTLIDHCNNNGEPMEIIYEQPTPFCDNLNESLKSIYGRSFIKRIDHVKKEVEIYNRYDSGKGMTIIPPNEDKPVTVNSLLKDFNDSNKTIIFIKNNKRTNYLVQKTNNGFVVWKDATYIDGRINGFKFSGGTLDYIKKAIGNIQNVYSYYPTGNEHKELSKEYDKQLAWEERRKLLDYDRDFINLCKAGDKNTCIWLFTENARKHNPDISLRECVEGSNEIFYQYNQMPE